MQRLIEGARTGFTRPATSAAWTPFVVGAADDRHEREADRVAEQVTGARSGPAGRAPGPRRATGAPDVQCRHGVGSGSVEAGVQAAVQRARGGGHALPDRLRRPLEQGMDADFGAVRLHTDARADRLSRALQARAFTTGNDVYFRRGQYDPASTAGRTLLAHELAHVVQQTDAPAATPAVQRKAGFEFETAVPTRGWQFKDEIMTSKSGDWHVDRDLGLEFVTKPFELNRAGYAELDRAMVDIAVTMAQYELISRGLRLGRDDWLTIANLNRFSRVTVKPGDPEEERQWGPAGIAAYDIGRVAAGPQMTVGLTLGRLGDVIADLPERDLASVITEERSAGVGQAVGGTTLSGAYPPGEAQLPLARDMAVWEATDIKRDRARLRLPALPGGSYERYAGFLALVLSYIGRGVTQDTRWDYPKVIATAMSRVVMSEVLLTMIHPALLARFTWPRIKFLVNEMGLRTRDRTSLVQIDESTKLFAFGTVPVPGQPHVNDLTVKEWIESLGIPNPLGRDALSAREASMRGFSVAQLEDDAAGEPLLPVELRQLPRQVRPKDWHAVAQKLFRTALYWQNRPPTAI